MVAPRAFWRDPGILPCRLRHGNFRLSSHPHRARALLGDAPVRPDHPACGAAGHRNNAAAATGRAAGGSRRARRPRGPLLLRLAVLALVAWGFWNATARIRPHVEYAGVIPRLEGLAARFTVNDLVVVESRNASDVHVLALPLAYIYDRHVLVLNSPKPDKAQFEVVSRLGAPALSSGVFHRRWGHRLAVADRWPLNLWRASVSRFRNTNRRRTPYPTSVRYKEFDFRRLQVRAAATCRLHGAHARRRRAGRPAGRALPRQGARSTRDVSLDARVVVSEPHRGARRRQRVGALDGQRRPARGRPPPAEVEVFIGEVSLGRVVVGAGMQPYTLADPRPMSPWQRPPARMPSRCGCAPSPGARARSCERPTIASSVLWWTAWRFGARPEPPAPRDVRPSRYLYALRALDRGPGRRRLDRAGPAVPAPAPQGEPAAHSAAASRTDRRSADVPRGDSGRARAGARGDDRSGRRQLERGHCPPGRRGQSPSRSSMPRGLRAAGAENPPPRWRAGPCRGVDGATTWRSTSRATSGRTRCWRCRARGVESDSPMPAAARCSPRSSSSTAAGTSPTTVSRWWSAPSICRPGRCRERATPSAAPPCGICRVPEAASAAARAALLQLAAPRPAAPLLAVHAPGGRAIKQWPVDRFADAASALAADLGASVVLTGALGDEAIVSEMEARVRAHGVRSLRLQGTTDLVVLAAVLQACRALLTGDTGPMHLAAAVGTPVLAVFGPSMPWRYGPLVEPNRIVRVDLPCSPCNRIRLPPLRCQGHTPDCLAEVRVDVVVAAGRSLLASVNVATTGAR